MELNANAEEQKRPVKTLPSGWEARLGLNGRVYYYSRHSHTVQILPPPESWSCVYGHSYGWEVALDYEDKLYFINHIQQQVTYKDPRLVEQMTNGDTDAGSFSDHEPPVPREYVIPRHCKLGFGFIAGSEKPVIIRTVSPGGPSDNMLQAGDQIIKIGNENVRNAPRERVITLIRESIDKVSMTVLQPARVANSSFLKPGKKLMKGPNRPRVRFAEDNVLNGEERAISGSELLVAPGVMKVYLQESQSRSFLFNPDTTAGDIVSALCEKLDIKDSKLYSLVLTPSKPKDPLSKERTESSCSDEILIPPWDHVAKILSNPSVKHHECRFRLTFVAKDIHKMSREDPRSFRYHYQQCVNDVVSGHVYADDLSTDDILRLASLQMLELSLVHWDGSFGSTQNETLNRRMSKKKAFPVPSKISLKQIEKDGLETFLPPSMVHLVSSSHSKEHRKTLQQHLKANFATYVSALNGNSKSSSPPPVPSTAHPSSALEGMLLQLRKQYIKVLSPLHLYGGRYFDATILAVVESDVTLIVGHHYGISQLINSKTKMASVIADFSLVESVEVASYTQEASKTKVRVDFKERPPLVVAMQPQHALNFACMISGYCRVHDNNDMMLTMPVTESNSAPEYFGSHKVKVSYWNYPSDADPSSIFYCDFSEPISFSLLSDHITDSVRFMYKHNRILDDDTVKVEKSSTENNEELDGEKALSTKINAPVDDEGVALTGGEVSPKSSVSSMASASPSSGIGSVTSHAESHSTGRQLIVSESSNHPGRSDDESEWNELMVALSSDDDLGLNSSESIAAKKRLDSDAKGAALVDQDTSNILDASKKEVLIEPDVTIVSNEETQILNEESEIMNTSSNTERSFTFPKDAAVTKEAKTDEKVAPGQLPSPVKVDTTTPPVVALPPQMPTRKFSSFKPGLAVETANQSEPTASTPIGTIEEEGNAITSDQFKLETKSTHEDVLNSHRYSEDILTSPLPVDDLARGHKSLKGDSNKKRHRISWFKGGSHSMSRSISLDKELEKSNDKAKSKSLLRNFFSPKRSSSTGKEPELFRLRSADAMFGTRSGFVEKQKFTGSVNFSPPSRKKSKFSFFKAFSRKKRSHTLHSPNEIGSPILIQPISGVYSMFEPNEINKNYTDGNETSIPLATSMEDVRLRSHDKISPKPRPVSFMTFQQLPSDFRVHKSPKESEFSPGRTQSPQLPLSRLVRSVVDESTDSESVLSSDSSIKEEVGKTKRTSVEVPFASFLKADLEEHFAKQKALDEANVAIYSSTAPVKPARKIGSLKNVHKSNQTNQKINDENINHQVQKQSATSGKVKRPAPPPPVVSPKPQGRYRINAISEITDDKIDLNQVKGDRKGHEKTATVSAAGTTTAVPESIGSPILNKNHINKDAEVYLPTDTSSVVETPGKFHDTGSVKVLTDVEKFNVTKPHDGVPLQNDTHKIPEVSEKIIQKNKPDNRLNNSASPVDSLKKSESATTKDDNLVNHSTPDVTSNHDDDSISSSGESPGWDDGSLVSEVLAALDKDKEKQKEHSYEHEISQVPATDLKVDDVVEISNQPLSLYKDSRCCNSSKPSASSNGEIKYVESEETKAPTSTQDKPSLVAHALNNLLLNGFDANSKLVSIEKRDAPLKEQTASFEKLQEVVPSVVARDVDDVDKAVVAIENHNNDAECERSIKKVKESNNKLSATFQQDPGDISSDKIQQDAENQLMQPPPAEEYFGEPVTIETSTSKSHFSSHGVGGKLPLLLPPPKEFNVPLSPPAITPKQNTDFEEMVVNSTNGRSPVLPSQDSSEAVVVILNGDFHANVDQTEPVVAKSADTGDHSNTTPQEMSDQLKLSFPSNPKPDKSSLTSPTSHLYHSLIAPRNFGKKCDVKRFTRVSAPTDKTRTIISTPDTDNDAAMQNGTALESVQSSRWTHTREAAIISHMSFPMSTPRSAQPVAAPKPSRS